MSHHAVHSVRAERQTSTDLPIFLPPSCLILAYILVEETEWQPAHCGFAPSSAISQQLSLLRPRFPHLRGAELGSGPALRCLVLCVQDSAQHQPRRVICCPYCCLLELPFTRGDSQTLQLRGCPVCSLFF